MSRTLGGSTRSPGEWAAVYRDEQQPFAVRRQAMTELIAAYADESITGAGGEAGALLVELMAAEVQRIARQVAKAASRFERDEFVQESLSLVLARRSKDSQPRICNYRPEQGALSGWLLSVLQRCWKDRLRRARRHPRLLENPDQIPVPDGPPGHLPETSEMLTVPFSDADLERLSGWDARYRVEVLCLIGFWVKVPRLLWEEWVQAYEAARNVALGRPFPPDDFLALEDPAARTAPFARLSGYSRANTLSVRWLRGRRRLEELDFVRDLRGN